MHMFAGRGWGRRGMMAGAMGEDKTGSLQRAGNRSPSSWQPQYPGECVVPERCLINIW